MSEVAGVAKEPSLARRGWLGDDTARHRALDAITISVAPPGKAAGASGDSGNAT